MKLLVLLLLISNLCLAKCPEFKRVNGSDPAPCNGFFFNNEAEKRIRDDVYSNKLRKEQLTLKDLQMKALMDDRESWKAEATKQAVIVQKNKNEFRNGFIFGTLGTILGTVLIYKAVK